MTQIELAKETLKRIDSRTFTCYLYATTCGPCADGYDSDAEIELSKEEILYLLRDRMANRTLFRDIKTVKVNLEKIYAEMAIEAAWPDGGPGAHVDDVIPDELKGLSEKLAELDESDANAISVLKHELSGISDGDYTFHFAVVDGSYTYYFAEDVEETIYLKRNEVLQLLHGRYSSNVVLKGLCKKTLDEDFINGKAETLGFAEDYDNFYYDGPSESLESFLGAWEYIIDGILSGDITEETLPEWLDYFDNPDVDEMGISEWFEEKENNISE